MTTVNSYLGRVFIVLLLSPFLVVLSGTTTYGQPQRINLGSLVPDASGGLCCGVRYYSAEYEVPAGKRLVIEQVFLALQTKAGAKAQGDIQVINSDKLGFRVQSVPFLFIDQGIDNVGKTVLTASHPMKLYVDSIGGKTITVRFTVFVNDTEISDGDDATISGYLEPLRPSVEVRPAGR